MKLFNLLYNIIVLTKSYFKMKDLMYKYPPDIQQAEKHCLSTRIFRGIQEVQEQSTTFVQECQCCGRKVGKLDASKSCCFSNSELAFLGPGIPLFFSFLLASIGILVVLSLIFSLFGIISNVISNDCQIYDICSKTVFNTLSIINKAQQDNYLSVQNYVLLGFIISYIVIINLIRYKFRKIKEQCDELVDSPSDYAIIIRRMDVDTTEADIKEMVDDMKGFLSDEQKKVTQNLRIINILLAPDLEMYCKILEQNQKQFKKCIEEDRQSQFIPQPLPDSDDTGNMAIVVFARQQSKQVFITKANICQKIKVQICTPCLPLSDFRIKGQNVAIDRAPEPDDIIWENGTATVCNSIVRRSLVNFGSLILLLAGGGGQYGLALFVNTLEDETQIFYVGIGSSLLIALMNQILLLFIRVTSTFEKCQTITSLNTILMKKISFFLFLNAGVFNVAANILADYQNFSLQGGSLSNEVTLIMILNSVTPNLSIFFLDYFDIIGKIKRFLQKRNILIKNLSQIQLNKMHERPGMDLPYQYGYIMRTLWLTAFYCPLTPIVVPISICGLFVNYWIEKCLHAKSYRAPNMTWTTVNDAALELFDFIPLIISGGQFLIYLYFTVLSKHQPIPDYWSIPIYVSLGISTVILFLPANQINKKLFKLAKDDDYERSYEEVEDSFEVTYEMVHPFQKKKCKKVRKRDKFMLASIFGRHHANVIPLISLRNDVTAQYSDKQDIKKALVTDYSNAVYEGPNNSDRNNNYYGGPQYHENPLNYLAQKAPNIYQPNNPNNYY